MWHSNTIWKIGNRAILPQNLAFPAPLSAVCSAKPETWGGSDHYFPAGDPFRICAGRLRQTSSIRDCVLVPDGEDDNATNQSLSQGAVQLLRQLGSQRLGIGWGHLIGQLVMWLEENPQFNSSVTDICPLWAMPASPPGTISPMRMYA